MNGTWDEAAWNALVGELDVWVDEGRQASFWWRDDDAGRPGPAFERHIPEVNATDETGHLVSHVLVHHGL